MTVSTDRSQTIKLFNDLAIEFTTTLANIAQKIPETEKKKRVFYYNLAITHCENFLKNGGASFSAQVRNSILDIIRTYHKKIQEIDSSHKMPDNIQALGLPKSSTSTGWGKFNTISMIIFCIFPLTGTIISGLALSNAKKGLATNVDTKIANITLIINIVITAMIIGLIFLNQI